MTKKTKNKVSEPVQTAPRHGRFADLTVVYRAYSNDEAENAIVQSVIALVFPVEILNVKAEGPAFSRTYDRPYTVTMQIDAEEKSLRALTEKLRERLNLDGRSIQLEIR